MSVQITSSSVSLPCVINRASLGDAKYVFVVIKNLPNRMSKVAWVPRENVTVEEQPLVGEELKANLIVNISHNDENKYGVTICNNGINETIFFQK